VSHDLLHKKLLLSSMLKTVVLLLIFVEMHILLLFSFMKVETKIICDIINTHYKKHSS